MKGRVKHRCSGLRLGRARGIEHELTVAHRYALAGVAIHAHLTGGGSSDCLTAALGKILCCT